jgi:hypothetical protein
MRWQALYNGHFIPAIPTHSLPKAAGGFPPAAAGLVVFYPKSLRISRNPMASTDRLARQLPVFTHKAGNSNWSSLVRHRYSKTSEHQKGAAGWEEMP